MISGLGGANNESSFGVDVKFLQLLISSLQVHQVVRVELVVPALNYHLVLMKIPAVADFQPVGTPSCHSRLGGANTKLSFSTDENPCSC